jgi:hypothetical protein
METSGWCRIFQQSSCLITGYLPSPQISHLLLRAGPPKEFEVRQLSWNTWESQLPEMVINPEKGDQNMSDDIGYSNIDMGW